MMPRDNPTTLLDAALDYAKRGWPGFPCKSRAKTPLITDWPNKATTDEGTIRRWYTQWPEANWGIVAGNRSGIVVLDVDPKHGGHVTLERLEDAWGRLPDTVEQHTGGGGRHLLFRYPANGHAIRNSAGAVGLGLDVRGEGGYIVVVPSTHESGGVYTWEASSDPEDIPLADAPAWLVARLQQASESRASNVLSEDGVIPEGRREDALLKLAGQLRRSGLGSQQIFPSLAETNRSLCKPPLDEKDVHRIAESVCRYPSGASLLDQPNAQPGKGKAAPASLHLTPLRDLLAEPDELVSWLVEPHLPTGGLSLLAGKPKAGKSTLARCLALAVAQGKPWLGVPTAQGSVLYLALEEKRSEVKRHFQAMGATEADDIRVFIAPSPQDGLSLLRETAERERPVLIIVDPLARMVRVKDLNDYAQVSLAFEPLMALARETGAHVLAVHHLGKGDREGGDSILGSTAIFAAVDTALILKRSDKYRTLSSHQRYGKDLEEMTLTMDPVSKTIAAGPSRHEVDQAQVAEAMFSYLQGLTEPVEEPAIHDAVEGRRAIKQRALRMLLDAQRVTRTGEGKRGKPYLYLVPKDSGTQVPHI